MGLVRWRLAAKWRDRTGYSGATAAVAATAATRCFLGAATRSTARLEPRLELTKFDTRIVVFGQFLDQIRHFGWRITQKIEEDRLTIE